MDSYYVIVGPHVASWVNYQTRFTSSRFQGDASPMGPRHWENLPSLSMTITSNIRINKHNNIEVQ